MPLCFTFATHHRDHELHKRSSVEEVALFLLLLLLDHFWFEGHNIYGLYAGHWPAGLFC